MLGHRRGTPNSGIDCVVRVITNAIKYSLSDLVRISEPGQGLRLLPSVRPGPGRRLRVELGE